MPPDFDILFPPRLSGECFENADGVVKHFLALLKR